MSTGSGVGIRSVSGQSGLRLGLAATSRVAFDPYRKSASGQWCVLSCLIPACRGTLDCPLGKTGSDCGVIRLTRMDLSGPLSGGPEELPRFI
jgi:hypothetical protein